MPISFGEVDRSGPQRFGEMANRLVDRSFQRRLSMHNLIVDAERRAHSKRVALGYADAVQKATTADEVVNAASPALGSLAGLGEYGEEATKAIQKDADMRLKVLAPDKSITAGDIAAERARKDAAAGKGSFGELATKYYQEITSTPFTTTKTTLDEFGQPRESAFKVDFAAGTKSKVDLGAAYDETAARGRVSALEDLGKAARIAKGKVLEFEKTDKAALQKAGQMLNRIVTDTGVSTDDPAFWEQIAAQKLDPTTTGLLRKALDYEKAKRDLSGAMEALKGYQEGYTIDPESSKTIRLSDIKPAVKTPPPALLEEGRFGAEGTPRSVVRPPKEEKTTSGTKKVGRFELK